MSSSHGFRVSTLRATPAVAQRDTDLMAKNNSVGTLAPGWMKTNPLGALSVGWRLFIDTKPPWSLTSDAPSVTYWDCPAGMPVNGAVVGVMQRVCAIFYGCMKAAIPLARRRDIVSQSVNSTPVRLGDRAFDNSR